MEVHFTPDTEAQLKQFAAHKGKDAAQVVEETVTNMLERQARFMEGVKRGIAAADRGDLIDHDEVASRIDRLFPIVTRIRWTTPAFDQLEAIVKHIQEENPAAARKTALTVLDSIAKLELFPRLGRPSEDVEGTRELGCPPYTIVYRLKDNVAEILYIWHGAQDWR